MSALPPLRRRSAGPASRFVAGPRIEDGLRVAGEQIAGGRRVAFEHLPDRAGDAAAELGLLAARAAAAGLSGSCELDVPVDRLGTVAARRLVEDSARAGLAVCLRGPAGEVDELADALPGARVAVRAAEPAAEDRCRRLADRRVRLLDARGAAAGLAFVRCLNVLLAGGGHVAVATADPRLLAVTGERAAWYDRPHESWEHVMPYGRRTEDQQRLLAAGATVRVAVLSGAGAPAELVRRLVRRGAA